MTNPNVSPELKARKAARLVHARCINKASDKRSHGLQLLRESYQEQFAAELQQAIDSLCARKPADPHYMIGGQTHPTIARSFAIEELVALLDKYEEKPYRGIFIDGNFVEWANEESETRHAQGQSEYFVYGISVRTANENGWVLPDQTYAETYVRYHERQDV